MADGNHRALARAARLAQKAQQEIGVAAGHAIGRTVDRVVVDHHVRRLRKVGWGHALERARRWLGGGRTPPREGNSVEVLIDGAEFLPLAAEELAKAQSHVHITGWYFSPELALTRNEDPMTVRNLLARARRAEPRTGAHLERRPGARVQPDAKRRPRDGRALLPRHEDHLRVRQLRALLALPPREDDRRRRPCGLRRRHRPDVRRRRPLRQPGAQGSRRCRLARHCDATARADRRGRRRALPAALARVDGGSAGAAGRPGSRRRPHGPARANDPGAGSTSATFRAATSRCSSRTSARSAPHERFIYIENQFLWSPEIVELLAEKLRDPPRQTSASSSSCRSTQTTEPTFHADR